MFEKVNPSHPDKIADRIAGHIVDIAYAKQENPKIAVEVLIGHNECKIVIEADKITCDEVQDKSNAISEFINKITELDIYTTLKINEQDERLAKNQEEKIKCGDNGIFKGCLITYEQDLLTDIVKEIYSYSYYKYDGKYIITNNRDIIACHSNTDSTELKKMIQQIIEDDSENIVVNPLGYWTGGVNVDTGATNRKLGSDMGDAVTGGGLHGKDLSKADVSVNIWCHIMARITGYSVEAFCSIGATDVQVRICGTDKKIPYSHIIAVARDYIKRIGGFEKFAEWGLIR